MFVSGMNPFSSLVFSFPTLIITIPATIIDSDLARQPVWLAGCASTRPRCLRWASFRCSSAAASADSSWRSLRSTSICTPPTSWSATSTWSWAWRRIFGIFAGTYFWFPKMTGRMMNETLGKLHFWFSFVGTYCIFMPFHYLGLAGNVRRYSGVRG